MAFAKATQDSAIKPEPKPDLVNGLPHYLSLSAFISMDPSSNSYFWKVEISYLEDRDLPAASPWTLKAILTTNTELGLQNPEFQYICIFKGRNICCFPLHTYAIPVRISNLYIIKLCYHN